ILPAALTLPIILPMIGGGWSDVFAFWSAPVAIIMLLVLLFAPRASSGSVVATGRRWWPDWSKLLIWRLGFTFGTVNAIYFGTNAFLPDYLNSHGQGAWISATLTGLNTGQLPASVLLLLFANRLELKVWPYIAAGLVCALATVGIVFGSGPAVVLSASIIGFAAAAIFVLVLALPPLLAPPDDVHRVTAAMFTISYSWAVVIPVISGYLWDASGIPGMAFLPILVCGVILALLAPTIKHDNVGFLSQI
ncbi:MAG: CynX/NimT family MFS transporter, partial [bacterium]